MSKYDGLNVKTVCSEFFSTPTKFANNARPAKTKKKSRHAVLGVFLILCFVFACRFIAPVSDVFSFVKAASAPTAKQDFSINFFKQHITDVFAPGAKAANKNFSLVLPVETSKEIRNDNGRIIFEIEDSELVKSVAPAKVKKIETNSLGRCIVAELPNGFEIRYYSLSVCAVGKGQVLTSGQLIGSVNKNLTLELWNKNKRVKLIYNNGNLSYEV